MITEEIIEEVNDEPPAKTSRIDVISTKSAEPKKIESWNRSVGVKKPTLSNLVRSKKPEAVIKSGPSEAKTSESINKVNINSTSTSSEMSTKADTKPAASGLSLLASYSGSDSD